MIFTFILLIYCLMIVIAYGIRFVFRLDSNNMSVCLKCFIFDWVEVFCIKLFVCEGLFYYQINKKQLKTIKNKEDEADDTKNKRKKKKKLKTGAYISQLLSKLPDIRVKRLSVNYSAEFEEIKNRALFDGCVMLMTNTLLAISSEKVKLQDFQLQNVSGDLKFNGVDAECVLNFALIKIALYALYAMIIKKKYQVAR